MTFYLFIYFVFSRLWNHNRFRQVCPDSHSRQQAQVRIILFFTFVIDQLIMEGFGADQDGTFVVNYSQIDSVSARQGAAGEPGAVTLCR